MKTDEKVDSVEYDESGQKVITLPIIGTKMREKTYVFILEGLTV